MKLNVAYQGYAWKVRLFFLAVKGRIVRHMNNIGAKIKTLFGFTK